MAESYPSGMYRDPSNMVDALRRAEKHLEEHTAADCTGCRRTLGRFWGKDMCSINKKRDEDGYCRHMKPRGAGDETANRGK